MCTSSELTPSIPRNKATDWTNLTFMLVVHSVAVIGGLFYLSQKTLAPHLLALWLGGFVLTTLAISAGYHRLFAHRTYETGAIVKIVWLFLGASAFQTSALRWARKHRLHHQHLDTTRDPYDATQGLWYSHMGWVMQEAGPEHIDDKDLRLDPLVAFQDRHYLVIAALSGFVLPTAIGALYADVWGGLLFGGVWRLVSVYHATFSINSLAHWIGSQPYSNESSARDSWLTAVVTMGEGYHNFHHTFPGDYRNGFRTFDFDPPKWLLLALAQIRAIHNLRRTPEHIVALRRLRTDRQRMASMNLTESNRAFLEQRANALKVVLGSWARASQQDGKARATRLTHVRRREYLDAYHAWRECLAVAA